MQTNRWVMGAMALLAAAAATASDLTAAQIVERNVAARGGLEAWRAVKSLTLTGQTDAGGTQDARLPFALTLARPNMSRLEIKFENKPAVQVYDGSQGWKVRPYLNRDEVEPFTAAEAKAAASAAELDGELIDSARKGNKVELKGSDTVAAKKAYRLLVTTKAGQQRNVWVDAASFLDVKMDGEPRKLDGKLHHVAIQYSDYRTVNGLNIPYTVETVVDGVAKSYKMSVETVTVNKAVDAALFARPPLASSRAAAR